MNKNYLITGIVIIILLLIWSPWITPDYARQKVIQDFGNKNKDIVDGCGLNCEGCGITSVNRQIFGYKLEINYKCGLKEYTQKDTRFVSIFGTAN